MTVSDPSATSTQPALAGARLILARAAWLLIVALAMVTFAAMVPTFVELARNGGLYAGSLAQLGISPNVYAAGVVALPIIQFAACCAVGILIVWRKSDDWWVMFVSVALITFGGFSVSGDVLAAANRMAVFRPLIFLLIGIWNATFVPFLYIFPNGKFAPQWTRWPILVWVVWSLASGVLPDAPFSQFQQSAVAIFIVPLIIYGGSVAIQGYRQRHYYNASQKQQTKWMLMGLLISLVGGYVLFRWPPLMFPGLAGGGVSALIFQLVSRVFGTLALLTVPVGIAFSILRYRLWDVDFLINRSIVYGTLTAGLVALFVAGFAIVQVVFTHLHEGMNAGIALAVSGVIFGLLFMPARRRLQRFIDQRLYGIKIDYNKTPVPNPAGSGIVTVGTRLGAYEISGPLGKGGMAEVYKGQHTTLGREVAIKTLPANLATESDFRKRFEREARTIAALKHPNIVELFDSGETDGTYYMVMEYFKGGDLSDYMKDTGPLKIDETRQLVAGIGGALDYAHQQGVVHRDIKPSNVMLQRNNGDLRPVLTDFGIARIMGGTTRITRTGMVGTFDYIAPEQIRDATDVDGRADVYSLAVMAFQLLTGRLPFMASNPGALLIAHLNQPAPNPRDLRADIPEEVAEATLRALEKDPARRFQTAGDFSAALA